MRHYLEEKLYSRQIFRVNPNEAETGDRNRSPKHKERQERKAAGLHSSLEFSALSGLKRTIEANDWKEGAEIPGDGPLGVRNYRTISTWESSPLKYWLLRWALALSDRSEMPFRTEPVMADSSASKDRRLRRA